MHATKAGEEPGNEAEGGGGGGGGGGGLWEEPGNEAIVPSKELEITN